MTCEELQKFMGRSPADCTTAEIAAVSNHLDTCASCYERISRAAEVQLALSGPLTEEDYARRHESIALYQRIYSQEASR